MGSVFNTILNFFNSILSGKLQDSYFRCHFRLQAHILVLGVKFFIVIFTRTVVTQDLLCHFRELKHSLYRLIKKLSSINLPVQYSTCKICQ